MNLRDKNVAVTGANRGIGQALVEEALKEGREARLRRHAPALAHPDRRVTPLTPDVTDAAQIGQAAGSVESLDILINNAGVVRYDDLSDRAALERAPRRQSIRHPWRDPGFPAVVHAFPGNHRQRPVCLIAHNRALDLLRARAVRMAEPIEAAIDVPDRTNPDPVEVLMRLAPDANQAADGAMP
jgi:NAD(P)-dependent dehydrogenase (short-subunit alcohol dehydrogenase family)